MTIIWQSMCGEKAPETQLIPPSGAEGANMVYMGVCAPCHGPEGKGDGPSGQTLNPRPRNFTAEKFKFGSDLASLIKTITYGQPKTSMLPWKGILKPEDIESAARYIRKLARLD